MRAPNKTITAEVACALWTDAVHIPLSAVRFIAANVLRVAIIISARSYKRYQPSSPLAQVAALTVAGAVFDMPGGLRSFAAIWIEVRSADKDEAAAAAMVLVAGVVR